jgi:hypothetical protein
MQPLNSKTASFFGSELYIPILTATDAFGVIRRMKNNRAHGENAITVELVKEGGRRLWKNICQLIASVWEEEVIPEK